LRKLSQLTSYPIKWIKITSTSENCFWNYLINNFYRIYDLYVLRINIAVATKRNITVKLIVTSSVGRHVVGINDDCFSYDMKNVGEAKWTNQISCNKWN
jgi:hypothetical protein